MEVKNLQNKISIHLDLSLTKIHSYKHNSSGVSAFLKSDLEPIHQLFQN